MIANQPLAGKRGTKTGWNGARYLYVISDSRRAGALIKIGKARDPQDRLRTLQTGNGRELAIEFMASFKKPGDVCLFESICHKLLSPYNAYGEWFNCGVYVAVGCILDVTQNINGSMIEFHCLTTRAKSHFRSAMDAICGADDLSIARESLGIPQAPQPKGSFWWLNHKTLQIDWIGRGLPEGSCFWRSGEPFHGR